MTYADDIVGSTMGRTAKRASATGGLSLALTPSHWQHLSYDGLAPGSHRRSSERTMDGGAVRAGQLVRF